MITVCKFGTFWIVYCPVCAWQQVSASWQEAETLRADHRCDPEPKLRIVLVALTALALCKQAPSAILPA
jgi:hypothetical protein